MRSSEREGAPRTAASSHATQRFLPGKWLEKEKQEIRFGVEQRRKEPGEETRDTKTKGHREIHTHRYTHAHTYTHARREGVRQREEVAYRSSKSRLCPDRETENGANRKTQRRKSKINTDFEVSIQRTQVYSFGCQLQNLIP